MAVWQYCVFGQGYVIVLVRITVLIFQGDRVEIPSFHNFKTSTSLNVV